MLELTHPDDIDDDEIKSNRLRNLHLINLISKYGWNIPLKIIQNYNITKDELNNLKGGVLTPRNK